MRRSCPSHLHPLRPALRRAFWLLTGLLLLGSAEAFGQATVSGVATAAGEPVPFANVGVRGTALGGAANVNGRYTIAEIPPGTYTLAASAVGYRAAEQRVTLADGDRLTLDFALEEAVIESEGVVVTGTMQETFVKESPVKVEVVSARYLEKIPTANVMDVIQNVNGLYQQVDCGVCYTNNIRINGMDGPYTAVLIDGMPIMSGLATVYGLNGISPALIQQIEVVKGPASALYGTEAMAGVINVITKDPATAPRLSLNTFGTSDAEFAADVAVAPTRGRFSTLLSGTAFYNDRFHDENDDGFADITLDQRLTLFGKGVLKDRDGFKRLDVAGRYYYERRLAGTEPFLDDFSDALRGSDEIYGESVYTNRLELMGSYELLPRHDLRLDVAYNWHDQDSYYGADIYAAEQAVYFGQLLWTPRLGTRNEFLAGATLRYQHYDDNAGSTGDYDDAGNLLENDPDNRLIPGVFVQNEYIASEALRLLGGLRLDHHDEHGLIFSPRLSVKVRPQERTTLRLGGGTGFRVVNLFTEDHLAYHGARATVLLEDLDPERSYSATASLQHILPFGANPLTIDLDGFYTYFTNKIEPDYDTPGVIAYRNLDGFAISRGVALGLSQSLTALPLSYTLGATFMDVFVDEDGQQEPLTFAADFQGTANLTYQFPRLGLALDYTANLTGPMRLPAYDAETAADYEAATGEPLRAESPTFAVHNVQVTKDFTLPAGRLVQVYAALENVFDYTQPSPLVGYYDGAPGFGDTFDSAYVYGPLHGRCLGLGLRLTAR